MAAGDVHLTELIGDHAWFVVEQVQGADEWTLTQGSTVGPKQAIPVPFSFDIDGLSDGAHYVEVVQYAVGAEVGRDSTMVSVGADPTAAIRPSVQWVADLVRTRAIEEGGHPADTFTDTTYPTEAQVDRLIDQAVNEIYTQLPGSIASEWATAGKHLSALYAAILVEASYFREQLTDDQVDLYRNLLTSGISGLRAASSGSGGAGGVASRKVDTVIMRGLATVPPEYIWMLDMPASQLVGPEQALLNQQLGVGE